MPLPKGFYYVGDYIQSHKKHVFFLLLGSIGAVFILYGLIQHPSQPYYVMGSSLLLVTAIYFNLIYFIALEIIILSGHGATLLGIGPVIQVILPILLSMQLFVYYWLSGGLTNIYRFLGIIGIALLSIGFSFEYAWIFCLGSLCVAIYATHSAYRGEPAATIWAIFNFCIAIFNAYLIIVGF